MVFLTTIEIYPQNIEKGEVEMPDYSEMNVQYRKMQNILSKIDYSKITNLRNISSALTAFTKDERWIRLQKNVEQLEKNDVLELAKTVQFNLPNIPTIHLDSITAIQDEFEKISDLDFSAIFSVSSQLSSMDIATILKKSISFADYDFDNMAKAMQKAFTAISERQGAVRDKEDNVQYITFENVVEQVQSEYCQEKITKDTYSGEEKKLPDESIVLSRMSIKIAIITLICSMLCTIGVGVPQIYLTYLSYKSSEESKHGNLADSRKHEKEAAEFNIDCFNGLNYQIVCWDNVMPRICHDCKSRVTGHLEKGKIVIIVNHYKKWVEIIWQNEDGKFCSGWIQNYKVTKFK